MHASEWRRTTSIVGSGLLLVLLIPLQVRAAEASNVRLVGYSDLQGRETLQVTVKGNYAYVGHHKGAEMNPLTGKVEPNGTSIIDISNPARPKIVVHIPGYKDAESRAVCVAENVNGKDYLLRNQESPEFTGFEVWEITDRAKPRRAARFSRRTRAGGTADSRICPERPPAGRGST